MRQDLFEEMPRTPAQHFKLYFFAAVLHLLEQLSYAFASWEDALKQFPFLGGYYEQLAAHGTDGMTLDEAAASWRESLLAWEAAADVHLPLRAAREAAGLDYGALALLATAGLVEEDARFAAVFESLQGAGGHHGPTLGLLSSWRAGGESDAEARRALRRLQELGLVRVVNPEAPRVEHALHVPALLWDVMHGETPAALAPWLRYRAPETLVAPEELIVPASLAERVGKLPGLLAAGEARALVVRGPLHNGRRTLLGAVALSLGRGVLEARGLSKPDDPRWQLLGSLATMLRALPVVLFDLAPGETAEVPALEGYGGPVGVVLGRQGGLAGAGVERALTLSLDLPDAAARRRHWSQVFGPAAPRGLDEIVGRFRMTGGNLRRAAKLARSYAALEGREEVEPADVRQASRDLNRQGLDALATRVETHGGWEQLALKPETMRELRGLESRCRHRERLHESVGRGVGAQLNTGVRALFSGPSGTGKTLAARLLASVLGMDLYRLDLSSVVNKYIGETEKNLSQVFARAEELDVILLLDEGDALLTQRTGVQSSNDRYANLETNYLLQRLEAYEGILLVTTNAHDRIDSAFQRRMDVVIDFHSPEASELWRIWQLHLPAGHAVDDALLGEVARRCSMNGGQIRNAVLHASLLALEDGGRVTSAHLEAAVRREYRKSGAVCPLRLDPVSRN